MKTIINLHFHLNIVVQVLRRDVLFGADQQNQRNGRELPLWRVLHWQRLQCHLQRVRSGQPWVKSLVSHPRFLYMTLGSLAGLLCRDCDTHSLPLTEQDRRSNCGVWETMKRQLTDGQMSCLVIEAQNLQQWNSRARLVTRELVYWVHFLCHCQSGAYRFQYALYVVAQSGPNGFIIALINRDKHWQHDGCCEHTLSLPLGQFIIIIFLSFLFFRSLPLFFVFVSSLPQ